MPRTVSQVFQSCAAGGTASISGVYGRFIDKFPFGTIFAKGLTVPTGQWNVHRYMKPLLDRIIRGEIDPPEIISHTVGLDDAPKMYELFETERTNAPRLSSGRRAATGSHRTHAAGRFARDDQ